MKRFSVILLCLCSKFVYLLEPGVGSGIDGNLRLCIVEGRGGYKRGARYCPVLDAENSGVECVFGTDRLDCLRRISKGTVDFGVFNPEDLIAAQWANINVLVTNELRQRPKPYERDIIAVVNRHILPKNPWSLEAVLRNSSLCHPGNEVNDLRPLSDTLAGYLESLIITRSCDPGLSLMENRLKAIAEFFNKACKAGPWVPDADRDAELKQRYPTLCSACGSPACSTEDRYWGISGALACLVEGAGDVMWGERDDINAYFGLNRPVKERSSYPSADRFAYLCRDGSWQTMEDNPAPCVWLNRPWPVIVAKRKAAAAVSQLVSSLRDGALMDGHWHGALAALLETREAPTMLYPARAPLDHLASARGFREAYSQSGCDPPRHITLCTTSLLQKNKCEWMSEAASVYGVTPPLQCSLRRDVEGCLQDVRQRKSDVTVTSGDWLPTATRKYELEPILYETTPIVEKLDTVVAYVRKDANITNMMHLQSKRAYFPRYDGIAWHSVFRYFQKTTCGDIIREYFSEICAPGIEKYNVSKDVVNMFTNSCYKEDGVIIGGEIAALRALVKGRSDVAFISMRTANMYQNNQILEDWANAAVEIAPVCPETNKKLCYLTWSNIGHVYTSKNITELRRNEITTVFTKLDQLFGKHQPFHSAMFTMYGPYNHQSDVLFHNNTKLLATEHILKMHPYDTMPYNFEHSLVNITNDSCQIEDLAPNSDQKMAPTFITLCALVFFILVK